MTSTCPASADAPIYSPDALRPESSVGYLMRRTVASIGGAVQRELDGAGLTNAQWLPLLKLSHQGGASTAAELARDVQLDAGAMTRLLDRLEAKQLVRRVRSQSDRRVVRLELTDAGAQAAAVIPHVLCKVLNAHLQGFSRDEVDMLHGFLARMLANGQAVAAEPPAADTQDTPA